LETIARMLPVFGWITTTAPSLCPGVEMSAFHAACCRAGLIVSVTLSVVVGSFSRKRIWLSVLGACWCWPRYES
jgi:hypothetical protein